MVLEDTSFIRERIDSLDDEILELEAAMFLDKEVEESSTTSSEGSIEPPLLLRERTNKKK